MFEELILKFIKFSLVGFSGLVIDFGVTWVAKERLGFNKYLANSLGFLLAVVNNYYWNKYWTFSDVHPATIEQFSLFLAIAAVGLLLSNGVIFLLNRWMNFYLAKAIAIGIVVLWNFIMNYLYAFPS